ncbi:MAG: DUF2318 domain-containing protein [Desulfobacteraceae bacterium]|nr:DUF2318 domain-containing protein [Desulfobacteraceae bacterium]
MIIGIACAILVVAGGVLFLNSADKGAGVTITPKQTAANAGFVKYPVSMFDDGKARHFEHSAGDLKVKYFILKSSDGIVRAAFDACDVCWPAGKGYYQDGDHMVCRNCGRRFASVMVNEVQGGCNPAPLNRRVENNELIIEVADINSGRSYFNFQNRG